MRDDFEFLRGVEHFTNSRTWILQIVLGDLNECGDFINNSNILQAIYDMFVPIGVGIAFIYFVMGLIDEASNSALTIDHIVKGLIKLFIAIMCIKNGYNLLIGIADVGRIIVNNFQLVETNIYVSQVTSIRYSFWNTVFNFTMLIPTLLLCLIIFVISKAITWSRMFEMGLYITIAPVALADISVSGIEGGGYRHLKRLLALSIQGVIIAVAIVVCSQISDLVRVEEGIFAGFTNSFLISLIMIKIMTGSKNIAKDLIGA